MKNLTKNLILISTLGLSTSAFSGYFDGFNWVLGLDYYQAWRSTKKDALSRILPKSFPGGTLYLGGKWDCFGFELGYDSSARSKQNWTLPAGTTIGNVTTSRTISGTSKVRFRGLHLDLLAYLPLDCNAELFGAIGYGAVGFRLGAGINYMVTECLGLRAKVGYEYNSLVRVTYDNSPFSNITGLNKRPYTNAGTVSLGGFVRF